MKIEKINDNQIRCTLTMADLASRKINLGELAYGSEKARNLFRDMMTEAYHKFGFNVDNVPIMIEAVPMSSEGIVLIITKVEDPEELDTRFSRAERNRPEQMIFSMRSIGRSKSGKRAGSQKTQKRNRKGPVRKKYRAAGKKTQTYRKNPMSIFC